MNESTAVGGKRRLMVFAITWLVISFPFVILHLGANPNDAPISPLQHGVAALANFFGPWGVAIVRLVDFPNAGLRSFSWTLAITLTLVGVLLLAARWRANQRALQLLWNGLWVVFSLAWFGIGLVQIASGLL